MRVLLWGDVAAFLIFCGAALQAAFGEEYRLYRKPDMAVSAWGGVMARSIRVRAVCLAVVAMLPGQTAGAAGPKRVSIPVFKRLMQTVADGWNEGNARKAADCFALDAVYTEPPGKQLYRGRAELFEFFGGDKPPQPPMRMEWHNLVFDAETQIGTGEYTFQMNNRYHGIVIVKLKDGLIARWREYQYPSSLSFDEFVGESAF